MAIDRENHITYSNYWKFNDDKADKLPFSRRLLRSLRRLFEKIGITIVRNKQVIDQAFISYPMNPRILKRRNELLAESLSNFFVQLHIARNMPDLLRDINDYEKVFRSWQHKNMDGGLGYNNGLFLFSFVRAVNPTDVIESGIWRGFGTYILNGATKQDCQIRSYDINLDKVVYRSPKASYHECDLTQDSALSVGTRPLAFYDDHVSHYDRLKTSESLKIKFLVFDDDVSFLNLHSDGFPPVPTISMLFERDKQLREFEWMVNKRIATADFLSVHESIELKNYIYVTPPDLFEITGYRNSSRTSYLVMREALP